MENILPQPKKVQKLQFMTLPVKPCASIRQPILQVPFPAGPICPWLRLMFDACETGEDLRVMAKVHMQTCAYCKGRKAA